MKRNIIFLVWLFFSCNNSSEKRPPNLVSKEKLALVLADIHRMEGTVNGMSIQNSDTAGFIFRKLEAEIFKKYDLDTAAYFQSYKYYLVNSDDFTDIYKNVVAIIREKNKADSLAETKLPKKLPSKSPIADSGKTVKPSSFLKKSAFLDSLKLKSKNGKKPLRLGKH